MSREVERTYRALQLRWAMCSAEILGVGQAGGWMHEQGGVGSVYQHWALMLMRPRRP